MKNILLFLFLAVVATPMAAMNRFSSLWRSTTPLAKSLAQPAFDRTSVIRPFTNTAVKQTAYSTRSNTFINSIFIGIPVLATLTICSAETYRQETLAQQQFLRDLARRKNTKVVAISPVQQQSAQNQRELNQQIQNCVYSYECGKNNEFIQRIKELNFSSDFPNGFPHADVTKNTFKELFYWNQTRMLTLQREIAGESFFSKRLKSLREELNTRKAIAKELKDTFDSK